MCLNKILAFSQLVIDKPEDEKKKLAALLDIDYEKYTKRMLGKEKEADFIVILKSLNALEHFVAFDEGLSHITKEYTPDFKIEMCDGYEMLIEVKHTDKEMFKISKGNLNNRKKFADRQNLPLRFAISLKGLWGLFTIETLFNKNGKLTLDDFIGPTACSWFDNELATCSYMFDKQIKIKSVYSTNHAKGMGIQHESYGQLISYELYYDNKRIFRAKGKKSKYIPYSIYLEALQDRIANIRQDIERVGEYTIITEYTDKSDPQIIPEYEFVLSPLKHMFKEIDSKHIKYNSLLAISERDFNYLSVQTLRAILSELVSLGLDIIVFRNNNGYKFEDYAITFWHKNSSK